MFGRGRENQYTDPTLGTLERHRGLWRGEIALDPFGSLPLSVPGSRSEPDADAIALARAAADSFERCRPQVETELSDHRSAYEDGPAIETAVAPCYVAVITLDRRLTLEFGYRVPWDEEHTLGARIRDGALVELSGSVLEP